MCGEWEMKTKLVFWNFLLIFEYDDYWVIQPKTSVDCSSASEE